MSLNVYKLRGIGLPIKKGDMVLDAGSGVCPRSIEVNILGGRVCAVDIDAQALRRGKIYSKKFGVKKLEVLVGDISNLPFRGDVFDKVLALDVLEHLPDAMDLMAIKEFKRVLRIGGKLFIILPTGLNEKFFTKLNPHFPEEEGGHKRIYNKKHFLRLLTKNGFTCYYKYGEFFGWLRNLLMVLLHKPKQQYYEKGIGTIFFSSKLFWRLDGFFACILPKSLIIYATKIGGR